MDILRGITESGPWSLSPTGSPFEHTELCLAALVSLQFLEDAAPCAAFTWSCWVDIVLWGLVHWRFSNRRNTGQGYDELC